MANKIILTTSQRGEITEGKNKGDYTTMGDTVTYVFPILEDFSIDYISNFEGMLTGIPGLGKIVQIMEMMQSLGKAGGGITKGMLQTEQFLEAPRWRSTEPPKFIVKILLYTKTDVYKDVWKPAKELISLSILQKLPDGTYVTPGLNLNSLSVAGKGAQAPEEKALKTRGQFVSVSIPGIIYLPMAYIEKVTPNFSKEVAYSTFFMGNFPIWAEIELSITGVFPATSEFLDMVVSRVSSGGR